MMTSHTLKIKSQVSELERIALFLEELGDLYGLSMKVVMNLNLVLEELVTNTIFYSFKDRNDHFIEIYANADDEKISIMIEDDGEPFDPTSKDTPESLGKPIEEQTIGGLGIHLVKNLMDSFTYERVDDKNRVYLIKNR